MAVESRNFISDEDYRLLNTENISDEQHRDADLVKIFELMSHHKQQPPWSEVMNESDIVRALWAQWQSLEKVNGILCRRFEDVASGVSHMQTVLPNVLHEAFVRQCHVSITGGHLAVRKTMEQVSTRRSYFVGWRTTVELVCNCCPECNRYIRGEPRRQGAMQIFEANGPMDRLAIDLTGRHPASSQSHVYILTVVDVFTRFLVAVPIRDKSAKTVANALFRRVFCTFGTCREIISDLGTEFNNCLLSELCELFGIRKLRITGYRPSQQMAGSRRLIAL